MQHPLSLEGEKAILEAIVSYKGGLTLRLFGNDVDPSRKNTTKAFNEIKMPGYKAVALGPSNWTITPARGGEPAYAEHPEVVFFFEGPGGDVHGSFYTQTKTGRYVWANTLDDAPFTVRRRGYELKITPHIALRRKV